MSKLSKGIFTLISKNVYHLFTLNMGNMDLNEIQKYFLEMAA